MKPAFWITLARGIFALTLGAALLLQQDKTRPMLLNFMGMYWLVGGIVSVRWGLRGERAHGLPLVAGVLGIIAGLTVLSRAVMMGLLNDTLALYLLALIVLLTGLLHMFGGFRTGANHTRERSTTSFLLGVIEVIGGVLLFIIQLEYGTLLDFLLIAWALCGGLILIFDALYLRRQVRLTTSTRADRTPVK